MRAHFLTKGKHHILMMGAKIIGITTDRKEAELFVKRGGLFNAPEQDGDR